MLSGIGTFFAERFRRWLPDSFIFALILTLIAAVWALFAVDAGPVKIAEAWYKGFWILLKFAMQMVLILVTGYAIAISPVASRFIDWLAGRINRPLWVYASVVFVGQIFTLISWGWIVLVAVLARELSMRVKGVDYRLAAAAVYASFLPWHGGLSGSIPLVLNTPENFLIKAGVLSGIIPTTLTLGSPMNIVISLGLLFTLPLLFMLMRPQKENVQTFDDLRAGDAPVKPLSVEEEANSLCLSQKCISDTLNSSWIISVLIILMGLYIIVSHFWAKGFDINLNIMNFLFIILGMMAHKTPIRYVVAMKRACSNVSGIIMQFPFYAGIMGIMIYTGLGKQVATSLAASTSPGSFPLVAFLTGGLLNIFVPSGGGEWAVVGQPIVEAAKTVAASAGMTVEATQAFIAKSSMAVGYGDSWTNMIQPFWTLAFFPIVAAGSSLQARDIMGYTFVALLWSFVIFALGVTFLPM
ncbi:short-chain fatty acids transporter [Desulfosarcina alkanivorans]|uniref:Short-chain fatty acids transporter n=1 Tax=Desulfosarcina alkanivorans TaxID=571177 RepID=A0A5K7YR37_9BACT|nr:TIGR00366 family protein [Desulfosarcina alkanivorans]BBO70369.1 short-chain fatty acids transporter [Desulfosarcina alkanivorans]